MEEEDLLDPEGIEQLDPGNQIIGPRRTKSQSVTIIILHLETSETIPKNEFMFKRKIDKISNDVTPYRNSDLFLTPSPRGSTGLLK